MALGQRGELSTIQPRGKRSPPSHCLLRYAGCSPVASPSSISGRREDAFLRFQEMAVMPPFFLLSGTRWENYLIAERIKATPPSPPGNRGIISSCREEAAMSALFSIVFRGNLLRKHVVEIFPSILKSIALIQRLIALSSLLRKPPYSYCRNASPREMPLPVVDY